MKLTKRQLKRIIKEEKAKLLKEVDHGGGWNGAFSGKTTAGNEMMVFLSSVLDDAGCTLDPETWSYIEHAINEVEHEAHEKGLDDATPRY